MSEVERNAFLDWLIEEGPSAEEFRYWSEMIECVSDMWDGFCEGTWYNDPVLWHRVYTTDNSYDQAQAYVDRGRFEREARERGHEVEGA